MLWRNAEIPNDILRQQKSFAVALRKQDNPKAHLRLRRYLAWLVLSFSKQFSFAVLAPREANAVCELPSRVAFIYIFAAGNSKKQLFELCGYSIIDSRYLQQEFIRQAQLAYSVGDYELGLLNEYGQRINITITLKRKNKNEYVTFRSGWMAYPYGKIVLTTPFGGK